MFHMLETFDIVFVTKMFLILLGNIFASWEANFVSARMFPEVGKQGNIDRKHNVSATMFPSLPRALGWTIVIYSAGMLLDMYIDCNLYLILSRNGFKFYNFFYVHTGSSTS